MFLRLLTIFGNCALCARLLFGVVIIGLGFIVFERNIVLGFLSSLHCNVNILKILGGNNMENISSLPSDKILKNFWNLCFYYKCHVNDGLCDLVFDAICRYSRAYMDRTGFPILVFENCPKLIALLKAEGLQ